MYADRTKQPFLKKYLSDKLLAHAQLARLDRPIGIWLLLLPTLWGILFASQGKLDLPWLIIFFIGAIVMRGAGCAINDLTDIKFDKKVGRTKGRPLASGRLSTLDALTNISVLLFIAFLCFLTLPLLAQKICIFALIFTFTYPLMKRLTYWPQLFLGITFSLGILIAGATIQGKLTLPQLLLYFSCVIWTIFFDTIYAHQDKEDDLFIGVKSTALLFEKHAKPFLLCCALAQILLLCLVGVLSLAPPFYYLGCIFIMLHLIAQITHVNLDDPASCAKTFQANHILGWLILANLSLIFYLK